METSCFSSPRRANWRKWAPGQGAELGVLQGSAMPRGAAGKGGEPEEILGETGKEVLQVVNVPGTTPEL